MSTATYLVGDVFDRLAEIPDGSVDLVMTSPPFLALRSYLPAGHPDKDREIGQEPTPAAFIDTLLRLTAEWRRVLAPHGSICVELGDTYSGSGGAGGDYNPGGLRDGQTKFEGSNHRRGRIVDHDSGRRTPGTGWPLAKSLTGIPTLYAWSLAYGRNLLTGEPSPAGQWRIRNLVAWVRPNPPVGALGDKFRPATSYLTIACVSPKRYFDLDAVREPHKDHDDAMKVRRSLKGDSRADGLGRPADGIISNPAGAPPLDWWKIPTQPYSGSHYACVDDQTEALTPEGWKPHTDLVDGEMIAAYDSDAHMIRWEAATFHRYPFDGELVAVEKRELSQRLTPNHRTLVRSQRGIERVIQAGDLRPSHRLPVAAPFEDCDSGDDPGVVRAAILGWFVTEGGGRYRQAHIYQSATANPEHCATIRKLLEDDGADFVERTRVRTSTYGREHVEVHWTISGELAKWLMETAPAKSLPSAVLRWSESSCRALLDALVWGDGHTRPDGRRQFVQKSRDTIDMVQALVCRLGMRSTISHRREGGYSLTIGERAWLSLRGTNGASDPIRTERYTGTVWCPSVPSSFWLARRNGRPFITGNTFPEALVVRPIEAMCPRKVCTVCGKPSERIAETTNAVGKAVGRASWRGENGTDGIGQGHSGEIEMDANDPSVPDVSERVTLGWTDCGHNAWRPGVVLDPFAGSGTTLAVATARGRDAIGIDLDERNLDLARQRIGMWLVEEAVS